CIRRSATGRRRSSNPIWWHNPSTRLRAGSRYEFSKAWAIYRSDVGGKPKPAKPEGGVPPPVGRPPSPSKKRDGRNAPWLIVRDESPPGYPLAGCSPAEPASVSPDAFSLL